MRLTSGMWHHARYPGESRSRNSPVTSKNRVSILELDLDLDVDVDALFRGKHSIYNIYEIALYLCTS